MRNVEFLRKHTGPLSALLFLLAGSIVMWRSVSPDTARKVIQYGGYPLTALCFGIFVVSLGKRIRIAPLFERLRTKQVWIGIVLVSFATLLTHIHEPHQFRVLQDEFALLGASQMMYLYRETSIPDSAQYFNGKINHFGRFVGIRGTFFQFLLSVMHDVTGYRVINPFLLNGLLTWVLYGSVYFICRRALKSAVAGAVGVGLCLSIPLLAQVATSGGYDLLNTVLVVLVGACAIEFVRRPSLDGQVLLIYTTLLASMTRSESLLYFLAVSAVVMGVWFSRKTVFLDWRCICSPVFLLLPFMFQVHMLSLPTLVDPLTRPDNPAFMSLGHLPRNISHALVYFFEFSRSGTNSFLASVLGVVGLVVLFIRFRRPRSEWRSVDVALLPVVLCVLLAFLAVQTQYWSRLTSPQASRFALPLYVMTALVFSLMVNEIPRKLQRALLIGVWTFAFTVSLAVSSRAYVTQTMTPSSHWNFFREFADNNRSDKTLFVVDGVLGLVTSNHSTFGLQVFNRKPDAIVEMKALNLYDTFYALEFLSYHPKTGAFEHVKRNNSSLHERFLVKEVEVREFSPTYRTRIVEIIGVQTEDGPVLLEEVELKAPSFPSEGEYIRFLRDRYPRSPAEQR